MSLNDPIKDISSRLAEQIRGMIFSGNLTEAAELRQENLASILGVSRTPLRQALQMLAHEGLIEMRHYRSARVIPIQQQDVDDLFAMRLALEPIALASAFQKISKVQIAKAEQCLDETFEEQDLHALAKANWAFHSLLYEPAKRPALLNTIRQLHERATRTAIIGLSVQARSKASHEEHIALLRACAEKQECKALSLLRDHLSDARQSTLNLLVARGH
jgi:DNA-binding GntR family transcriptional regulator